MVVPNYAAPSIWVVYKVWRRGASVLDINVLTLRYGRFGTKMLVDLTFVYWVLDISLH